MGDSVSIVMSKQYQRDIFFKQISVIMIKTQALLKKFLGNSGKYIHQYL